MATRTRRHAPAPRVTVASIEADLKHRKIVDAMHQVHAAAVKPSPESTTDRLALTIERALTLLGGPKP